MADSFRCARQGMRIVCRRSGPTETIVTGTPTCRPRNSTYSRAALGRSDHCLTLVRSSCPAREASRRSGGNARSRRASWEARWSRRPSIIIRHGDLQLVDSAQDVQEHDRQLGRPADPRGVANGDRVEPAATARPAGHRSVLLADAPDSLADRVVLLGRKRPAADAGRVGLDHADPAIDVPGRHARPRRDSGRAAVGAGHIRITAMIDVQQRALGPLEEQPPALRRAPGAATTSCRGRTAAAARR